MGRCDYKERLRHAFIHGKEVIQCVHHTSENAGVLERYGTAGGHIALVAMIWYDMMWYDIYYKKTSKSSHVKSNQIKSNQTKIKIVSMVLLQALFVILIDNFVLFFLLLLLLLLYSIYKYYAKLIDSFIHSIRITFLPSFILSFLYHKSKND